MEDRVLSRPPEHHVEFGESEDEAVLAINQNDVGGITELLRQLRREFESAEPSTQDNHAHTPDPKPCTRSIPRRVGRSARASTKRDAAGMTCVSENAGRDVQRVGTGKFLGEDPATINDPISS